ncbi:MAG: ParA family protein [Sphingomonadales bacterium]|nr:ParA family protein [Sphingomonadales bacterium]
MPTIVIASPKGGTGKSTVAVILATEMALLDIPVTILDTDPNLSVTRWANAAKLPNGIQVIGDITESNIIKMIREHEGDGKIVIVDPEGIASRKMSRAITQADLVITPMRPTSLDADIGAEIINLIEEEEEALGRKIQLAVAFTMTSNTIISMQERGIHESLVSQGVDVIECKLALRSAYSALFATGGNLYTMPPQGNMEAAKANAKRFAETVLIRLEKGNTNDPTQK